MNIKLFKNQVQKKLDIVRDFKTLDKIWREYLGKKGEISKILSSLKDLPKEERRKIGKEANILKKFLETKIEEKKEKLRKKIEKETVEKDFIDTTIPAKKIEVGHLHPLSLAQREIIEIFQSIGFSVVKGPHIETEWYNFDALNMPKNHPSRDMQDTFWLKEKTKRNKRSREGDKILMRTQTSALQIRYMEENKPPLKIIVPGRVFRHEASEASHDIQFYQVEGLMVDKNISLANLKSVLEFFLRRFFGKDIKFRWRPGYFPYVEPGLEVDVQCSICKGKGCSTCKRSGWSEVIGAGMVHPKVFMAVGYSPKDWQGFAFGMGFDRLVMMKYKINDIRLFYSGDLRFLKQF